MIDNNNSNTLPTADGPEDAMQERFGGGGLIPDSLFRIAWRGRWLILACIALAVTAAFVYIQKATPIYESSSQVYVEQSGPKIIDETRGFMTQSKNYLYTQAVLLTSTPVINIALESPGIRGMKTFTDIDNAVAYLKKKVDVSVGKKDDLITASFRSPYPAEAAQLVNALVDAYITYHSTTKKKTSAEVLTILQKDKTKTNTDLNTKLTAMTDFKKANEALAFENRNGNIILDRLAQLSNAMTRAQLRTIEDKSIYEVIKAMVDDPGLIKELVAAERAKRVYVSGYDERNQFTVKLNRFQDQLADLTGQVPDDHPASRALLEKIKQINDKIDVIDIRFAKAQLAIIEQKYAASKEEEQQTRTYFEDQRQQALDLNEQVAQYTLLESDYQQTRKYSDMLDDRIKKRTVTEDVGALNISILEVARPADKPSSPQKARILAMALVLGMMLGGGLSLLRDFMDHRLHSVEEIMAILGTPVLGTIPHMLRKLSLAERGTEVHIDSGSITAESYRTVRTAVFFGVPEGSARTLLITSPDKSDGKTTLASNLAIAMAQAGQKTLLIDTDLRKPKQHIIFALDRAKGLSALVSGQLSEQEAIQSTDVDGLSVLTAGPDVPNPSELLNNQVFTDKLNDLAREYDRIILDSPPVVPVSDARILAAVSDVTLLVLRAGKSTRNVSRHACELLYSVGAKLLGVIVNDVSPKKGRYGYSGYGYGHRYGYGHSHYGYGHKKKTAD